SGPKVAFCTSCSNTSEATSAARTAFPSARKRNGCVEERQYFPFSSVVPAASLTRAAYGRRARRSGRGGHPRLRIRLAARRDRRGHHGCTDSQRCPPPGRWTHALGHHACCSLL